MYPELIPAYIFIFIFGIVIGSFLNVCILRIPKHETIVTERSHCMSCGCQLSWYDMVPVFSWLFLGGKCRKCKAPISPQYPIVEAVNGLLYVLIFLVEDFSLEAVLYCLLASALLVLSVIDWRTYEIPVGINIFILILGILRVITDYRNWWNYLIGFLCVSIFLYLLFWISKGRAIGGGDIKLMAAAGLLLGWKLIILAFLLGCILGAIIHLIRMRVSKADHVLAMGPYLSVGIFIAALWGNQWIGWYLSLLT
ncbi:MAG: prepilin peptidase [Lachnospiraceae bacterium]|nr:prepilin peptidase [Lachnospiraceae bacterium]